MIFFGGLLAGLRDDSKHANMLLRMVLQLLPCCWLPPFGTHKQQQRHVATYASGQQLHHPNFFLEV
jgi:hypothetical protein